MNFTILFPTRERPSLLTDLCRSLNETTSDKGNLEVLTAYDSDDHVTAAIVPDLMRTYPWLRCLARERSSNISRDYHNWLYRQSTGKFIIVINDDVLFRTSGWDSLALNKLNAYLSDKSDGVVYGWISDSLLTRHGSYCCFPLVSRAAADVLGYVMHDHFSGWGADIHLYNLYASVNRVLDMSEILIDHISYHSGKREKDATGFNMQRITSSGNPDVVGDRRKLMMHVGCPMPVTTPTPYIEQVGKNSYLAYKELVKMRNKTSYLGHQDMLNNRKHISR